MRTMIMKKLFNGFKSKIAILIVLSMVLTMVFPHINILSFNSINVVYASTELKAETIYPI
jgi:hypothetical protein